MEKREIKYLVNYKKEIYSILEKYNLSSELGKIDATMEIKDILLIDSDSIIKNKCTLKFLDILTLIKRKVEPLQSDMLFDYVAYIDCMVDMLRIFEKENFNKII